MTFKQGPLAGRAGYWNCMTEGCSSRASKQTGRKSNPPVPGIACGMRSCKMRLLLENTGNSYGQKNVFPKVKTLVRML